MDERVVVLSDERRIVLRPIAPHDAAKLREGFHALSPAARYQRFMGQIADLTPSMLRYLTEVDGVDHFALVAVLLDPQEREQQLVGVARAIRLPDRPNAAELAVVVGDPLQRMGLGSLLMEGLLAWAERQAVGQLIAHALPSNHGIVALLSRFGHLRHEHDGVLTLDLLSWGGVRAA